MEEPPQKSKFTFEMYQRLRKRVPKGKRPKFKPLTSTRIFNTFAAQVFRMYTVKSGLMGSSFIVAVGAYYTGYMGPTLENKNVRFALAGTAATMVVDFVLHGLDTFNMRAKAAEGGSTIDLNKKLRVNWFSNLKAYASLFRGATSIVYGIAPSAAIYFWLYPQFRDQLYDVWREYN